MSGRGAALRVGALVIATAALLVAMVWVLGGRRNAGGARYETYFRESVQGLDVGSAVKFRGVVVGQVTAIGLAAAEYGAAADDAGAAASQLVVVHWAADPARLGMTPSAEQAARTGLHAKLAAQGLTGQNYLELDYVAPDRYPPVPVPWTPRTPRIPSMPSTIGQVTDAAKELLEKLRGVDVAGLATGAAGLINDLRGQLEGGDMHRTLAGADTLLRNLNATVQDADLPGLVRSLRATSTAVHDLAAGSRTRALLAHVDQVAERFARVAVQLPPLIAALGTTATRADGTTADLQAALAPILRDARAAVANLRDTTEALRRDPAGLILSAPPPRDRRSREPTP